MWDDLKLLITEFFETHRTRKIGFLIGLITGVSILVFGFINTFFAGVCGLIGLCIGAKIDGADDLIDKTLANIDRFLPNKFRR